MKKPVKTCAIIGTREHHLHGNGKMYPAFFVPRFAEALAQYGIRLATFGSLDSLRAGPPAYIDAALLIYNEENIIDQPRLQEVIALEDYLASYYDAPEILHDHQTGLIISSKIRTNRLYRRNGVPVPRSISETTHNQKVLSLPASGSGNNPRVYDAGEQLPSENYNVALVNTAHDYQGESYLISLRLNCFGGERLSMYVRARLASDRNVSVHAADTPADSAMLNYFYLKFAERLPELDRICRDIGRAIGPGFYAHDVVPCAETGQFFVCETGFKTDDKTYIDVVRPVVNDLYNADFFNGNDVHKAAWVLANRLICR